MCFVDWVPGGGSPLTPWGGEVTQAPSHLCCVTQHEQQFYRCPRLLLIVTDRHNINEEEGSFLLLVKVKSMDSGPPCADTQHRRRTLSALWPRDTRYFQ